MRLMRHDSSAWLSAMENIRPEHVISVLVNYPSPRHVNAAEADVFLRCDNVLFGPDHSRPLLHLAITCQLHRFHSLMI